MSQIDNPYQPPVAEVQPLADNESDSELLDEPRRMPFLAGARWIGGGGQLFGHSWGVFILMFLIGFAISVAFQFIPLLGLLYSLLYFVLVAGWMVACDRVYNHDPARLEDLFAGFQNRFGTLVVVGLLYLAASFLIGVMLFAAFFTFSIGIGDSDGNLITILGLVLVLLLITFPPLMAVWFAPALIVLHDMDAMEAMRRSFFGCLRNILPFILYGILSFLLLVVATLPLLLGLLVVMPLLACSVYAGYRDIFLAE